LLGLEYYQVAVLPGIPLSQCMYYMDKNIFTVWYCTTLSNECARLVALRQQVTTAQWCIVNERFSWHK